MLVLKFCSATKPWWGGARMRKSNPSHMYHPLGKKNQEVKQNIPCLCVWERQLMNPIRMQTWSLWATAHMLQLVPHQCPESKVSLIAVSGCLSDILSWLVRTVEKRRHLEARVNFASTTTEPFAFSFGNSLPLPGCLPPTCCVSTNMASPLLTRRLRGFFPAASESVSGGSDRQLLASRCLQHSL